ncbi:TRAPP subunit bet5 [Xylographa opegraphella]|nr:TRAPP subunit bet5 [Xylographa opegraphella]
MVVFSFYIFDRHGSSASPSCPQITPTRSDRAYIANDSAAECVYKKKWLPPSLKTPDLLNGAPQPRALSAEDDAKLVFGTIFSLRNMVRKLGGVEDKTGHYKLHYYETPTSLKFVMVTDTKTNNLRIVLHQIYVGLYVEYGRRASTQRRMLEWLALRNLSNQMPVVKNPLAPVEHPGGVGVNCEMFELGLEQFITGTLQGA